jgi:hypothetical protein
MLVVRSYLIVSLCYVVDRPVMSCVLPGYVDRPVMSCVLPGYVDRPVMSCLQPV